MEFKPDVKEIILNYLKDGKRDLALSYIIRTFHTSNYDGRKLLEAFETQFNVELGGNLPKKFDLATCSGCLSRVLKLIAMLLALVGIGIFVMGYYFIALFGDEWNYRPIPVVVIGLSYPYRDSTYVNLIYEYDKEGQTVLDTGSRNYDSKAIHVGDTATVYGDELGLGLDSDTVHRMQERQEVFYYVAAGVLCIAFVFWVVSVVFKVSAVSRVRPSVTVGRYSK